MSASFSQVIILFAILVVPLLFPVLYKKWIWLLTVVAGYVAYISWGFYLHATADITEYGTGYGIFIVPYIIGISILGGVLQRILSKAKV